MAQFQYDSANILIIIIVSKIKAVKRKAAGMKFELFEKLKLYAETEPDYFEMLTEGALQRYVGVPDCKESSRREKDGSYCNHSMYFRTSGDLYI